MEILYTKSNYHEPFMIDNIHIQYEGMLVIRSLNVSEETVVWLQHNTQFDMNVLENTYQKLLVYNDRKVKLDSIKPLKEKDK